jgi:3-deoxy-D-manno-octulosonic-acid transferase
VRDPKPLRALPAPARRLGSLFVSLAVDALYILASPVVLLYLLLARGRFRRREEWRGFIQKLSGAPPRHGERPAFWVHAVSVGEVVTAVPLVEALAARFPEWDVAISSSTPRGLEVARKRFAGRDVFYAPLDLSVSVRRSLRRRRPRVILLVELELWPNLLLGAYRHGVPVVVVNGRMTERSSRRYAAAGALARFLFRKLSACAVQNELYAERFRRLGVPPSRLGVLGNLKYDVAVPDIAETSARVRNLVAWDRTPRPVVLVAGSTHAGEEILLCGILPALRAVEPSLRLVLVPRHVERVTAKEIESWGPGLRLRRWSEVRREPPAAPLDDILVVDTVGDLESFYAAADLVFVGGSLAHRGGHNLLEPTRLGKATCFGPHHENFREEAAYLLERDAARCVRDRGELEGQLLRWLRDPEERDRLGARAARAVDELRGAARRHVEWLDEVLALSSPRRS